jgi:hypothetical protein
MIRAIKGRPLRGGPRSGRATDASVDRRGDAPIAFGYARTLEDG